MVTEGVARPIWHLHPRSRNKTDNMIKVTYENGSVLFIGKRADQWFVDTALLPVDLCEIQKRHSITNFEVVRYSSNEVNSGYVGSALILDGHTGDSIGAAKIRCTSVPVVVEIVLTTRPSENTDVAPEFLVSDDAS